MDYQDHHQTHIRLKALRDAGGQFKSSQQLEDLFWVMPSDFSQTHAPDFAYALAQARTAPDQNAGFRTIIYSNAVKWLRDNNPAQCAAVIADSLSMLPQDKRPQAVDFLISGEFMQRMSYETPHAYAEFFTKMVASLDDKAGSAFATIKPLPTHPTSVFAIFPAPFLRLPPYVLIEQDGELKPKPMTVALRHQLPRDALEALYDIVEQEAQDYGAQKKYEIAAVLSQAAFYVKPGTMSPA